MLLVKIRSCLWKKCVAQSLRFLDKSNDHKPLEYKNNQLCLFFLLARWLMLCTDDQGCIKIACLFICWKANTLQRKQRHASMWALKFKYTMYMIPLWHIGTKTELYIQFALEMCDRLYYLLHSYTLVGCADTSEFDWNCLYYLVTSIRISTHVECMCAGIAFDFHLQ